MRYYLNTSKCTDMAYIPPGIIFVDKKQIAGNPILKKEGE
jgi:hypothetical protein